MEKIQPIINGSVNPNLTPELFNELDFNVKRKVIWGIMVSMGFAHSFPGVDQRCFIKPKEKFSDSSITPENANDLFVEMKKKYQEHHNKMLAKTRDLYYDLGAKIYDAQKELGFGGFVELDAYRLKGYVSRCGSWNDFNHRQVGAAIAIVDDLAPRKDYGVNNPNSGSLIHKWKTVHGCEYIIMEFDFVREKDVERIKEFYQKTWELKGREIKADSIRIEINPLDNNGEYYNVELIWWWD